MKFEKDAHLHSREHVLADDLSSALGEPKRFAAYLGIARMYDESDLRALLGRIREKADLPLAARGKYFFACLKGLTKIPRQGSRADKPAKEKKNNGTSSADSEKSA
ncbi:MAG: hypothetical protein A3I44_01200 [Candidatus Sungbacteria bacterium RIFCSPLOWO2_02_FULL_51_17]|uniref:Uncharacterized protein n=1 Tax=Candidatus Sungbacteria bacterium RIFCSPHIGHO2_02_FULL_51_29 TaxID=1802273 RepID=A0A1G2KUA1_9BACT|nr:MAG: hypothetical protein A2676_00905 [Candidatus Sungbacteria bacterium RIFCSPHIGHO2_01_FULL_51_22]OHA02192.1 MAG: hypothetical protein A3C16_00700 [Candidatus Sungbacteria bacterium RIFCSPHIGHO2_02_FULL_51_29]OHA10738.1 MAG: hypothetical protein A3I44_01200 [Candidatus Sungbacteria bacterium RIFCSPLOWO2_02_FULL_51_17]